MVARDSDFAQDRVPGGSRDDREEIDVRFGDEIVERRVVGKEPIDRRLELGRRRPGLTGRPVVRRPARLPVLPVADVVEDVPLGDPEMLEQVPRRIRHVRWEGVDRRIGEFGDGLVEGHPGVVAVDEPDQFAT